MTKQLSTKDAENDPGISNRLSVLWEKGRTRLPTPEEKEVSIAGQTYISQPKYQVKMAKKLSTKDAENDAQRKRRTPEEKEVSIAGQRDFSRIELALQEKEPFNHDFNNNFNNNLLFQLRKSHLHKRDLKGQQILCFHPN